MSTNVISIILTDYRVYVRQMSWYDVWYDLVNHWQKPSPKMALKKDLQARVVLWTKQSKDEFVLKNLSKNTVMDLNCPAPSHML